MYSHQFGELELRTTEARKQYTDFILSQPRVERFKKMIEDYYKDQSIPRYRQMISQYPKIASLLDDIFSDLEEVRILEIGPSGLLFAKYLKDKGAKVSLFDGSLGYVNLSIDGFEAYQGDLRNIKDNHLLRAKIFDVIVSSDVFVNGSGDSGIPSLKIDEFWNIFNVLSRMVAVNGIFIDASHSDMHNDSRIAKYLANMEGYTPITEQQLEGRIPLFNGWSRLIAIQRII